MIIEYHIDLFPFIAHTIMPTPYGPRRICRAPATGAIGFVGLSMTNNVLTYRWEGMGTARCSYLRDSLRSAVSVAFGCF